MCEKERIFKNWLKERIGEIIEKMEMIECLRLLKSEKHVILPMERSFKDLLKEASWEEVEIIGKIAMYDKEIFELFLNALPIEQRIKFLEKEDSIGSENAEIVAIALREYLEIILGKQVKNFGKRKYFINIPDGPASKGETIEAIIKTLVINEKKEIPIEFAIIRTDDLLSKEKKENLGEYGVGIRIIKGVQRHYRGLTWEEFLCGVELCFIPRKGYIFEGKIIRRPYPYSWVEEVDIYDEEVEIVIQLIEKGGISIKWPSVADITIEILQCNQFAPVDWSRIQEINENERKRKGYYKKEKN